MENIKQDIVQKYLRSWKSYFRNKDWQVQIIDNFRKGNYLDLPKGLFKKLCLSFEDTERSDLVTKIELGGSSYFLVSKINSEHYGDIEKSFERAKKLADLVVNLDNYFVFHFANSIERNCSSYLDLVNKFRRWDDSFYNSSDLPGDDHLPDGVALDYHARSYFDLREDLRAKLKSAVFKVKRTYDDYLEIANRIEGKVEDERKRERLKEKINSFLEE